MDPRWHTATPARSTAASTLLFDRHPLRDSREFDESEDLDRASRRRPVRSLLELAAHAPR